MMCSAANMNRMTPAADRSSAAFGMFSAAILALLLDVIVMTSIFVSMKLLVGVLFSVVVTIVLVVRINELLVLVEDTDSTL